MLGLCCKELPQQLQQRYVVNLQVVYLLQSSSPDSNSPAHDGDLVIVLFVPTLLLYAPRVRIKMPAFSSLPSPAADSGKLAPLGVGQRSPTSQTSPRLSLRSKSPPNHRDQTLEVPRECIFLVLAHKQPVPHYRAPLKWLTNRSNVVGMT